MLVHFLFPPRSYSPSLLLFPLCVFGLCGSQRSLRCSVVCIPAAVLPPHPSLGMGLSPWWMMESEEMAVRVWDWLLENLTELVVWVALGELSKVEELPDSDHLVLPMLGCMQSLRYGPIIVCSGMPVGLSPARLVVTQLTQGLCAWALLVMMCMDVSSAEMGVCSPGAESFPWLCSPGVLGDTGVWHREAGFLLILGCAGFQGHNNPSHILSKGILAPPPRASSATACAWSLLHYYVLPLRAAVMSRPSILTVISQWTQGCSELWIRHSASVRYILILWVSCSLFH